MLKITFLVALLFISTLAVNHPRFERDTVHVCDPEVCVRYGQCESFSQDCCCDVPEDYKQSRSVRSVFMTSLPNIDATPWLEQE